MVKTKTNVVSNQIKASRGETDPQMSTCALSLIVTVSEKHVWCSLCGEEKKNYSLLPTLLNSHHHMTQRLCNVCLGKGIKQSSFMSLKFNENNR